MINSSSDSFSIPKNNSGFTDFSVDSDRSIPKKFLQTTQNNTKFLGNIEPNEGLEINSNIQINLDYSSFSPINDRNIKSDNLIKINPIGSPIRSAIKKSPTCFFNNSNDNTPVHDNSPEGGFNKKRTIKFGEKEEIRFFTMKEGTATDKNTNTINIEKDKESRMSSTSRSQKGLSSGTSKDDDKLNTKEKKEASFGKNITILMIINHFLKNLKLKSGRFGRLGMKQCKIVNDFAHDVEVNAEEDFEMETNLMARMIVKLIQFV